MFWYMLSANKETQKLFHRQDEIDILFLSSAFAVLSAVMETNEIACAYSSSCERERKIQTDRKCKRYIHDLILHFFNSIIAI